jgi:hypothetical protein
MRLALLEPPEEAQRDAERDAGHRGLDRRAKVNGDRECPGLGFGDVRVARGEQRRIRRDVEDANVVDRGRDAIEQLEGGPAGRLGFHRLAVVEQPAHEEGIAERRADRLPVGIHLRQGGADQRHRPAMALLPRHRRPAPG